MPSDFFFQSKKKKKRKKISLESSKKSIHQRIFDIISGVIAEFLRIINNFHFPLFCQRGFLFKAKEFFEGKILLSTPSAVFFFSYHKRIFVVRRERCVHIHVIMQCSHVYPEQYVLLLPLLLPPQISPPAQCAWKILFFNFYTIWSSLSLFLAEKRSEWVK